MKVLILGSTGMLGRALVNEAQRRNFIVFGAALRDADFCFDVVNDIDLVQTVQKVRPDIIINTIAIIDHELCEKNPSLAYMVNARPISVIAHEAKKIGAYVVHVSTDHYFSGHGCRAHTESDPVELLNEYARSKYVAETLALTYINMLVVRTNIVGFRYEKDKPTFVEWVINSLQNQSAIALFDDYYTSSIDVHQCSVALFDLIQKRQTGLLNVASSQISSKKEFIQDLAAQLGFDTSRLPTKSVKTINGAKRAESLGLDVTRAEFALGYALPNCQKVIESIVKEYREGSV
jgi:dTDP-4-dehydrorhamnose reductase